MNKLKAADNIAIRRDKIYPFGSATYRNLLFPGDLDLREIFRMKGSKEHVVKEFTKELQKLVKKINKEKLVYYSEVKCGFDEDYIIPSLGDVENGYIQNYNFNQVRNRLKELFQKKLLKQSEFMKMVKLATPNISRNDHDKLFNLLREKWLLRWSADEIIKGVKHVPVDSYVKLEDALMDKTMVKIDTIMFMPQLYRFIEVTDFFILMQDSETGEQVMINLPDDALEEHRVIIQLKREIEKLYNSEAFRNPVKMLKRMYSLNNIFNDGTGQVADDLEAIDIILNSSIGLTSQILSDIDSLILLLERVKKPPLVTMNKEINNFKSRISSIVDFELPHNIFDLVDKACKTSSIGSKIKALENIKDEIKPRLYQQTIKDAEELGLWPLPERYFEDSNMGGGTVPKMLYPLPGHYYNQRGGAGTSEGARKAWETRKANKAKKEMTPKKKSHKKPSKELSRDEIFEPVTKSPVYKQDKGFDDYTDRENLKIFTEGFDIFANEQNDNHNETVRYLKNIESKEDKILNKEDEIIQQGNISNMHLRYPEIERIYKDLIEEDDQIRRDTGEDWYERSEEEDAELFNLAYKHVLLTENTDSNRQELEKKLYKGLRIVTGQGFKKPTKKQLFSKLRKRGHDMLVDILEGKNPSHILPDGIYDAFDFEEIESIVGSKKTADYIINLLMKKLNKK